MKPFIKLAVLFLSLTAVATTMRAQVPDPAVNYQPLAAQQLDQLLGPIALYPDPLIAQLLPAAAIPSQIVMADRYVNGGGDPGQIEQQPWDASVQALGHYPSVLKWMDDNLNWTTEVGQAYLNQQQDVMDSIQRLRTSAYNMGNLQSNPQQSVVNDSGYIEIDPVDPNEMYVPDYQPNQVYYQTAGGAPFVTFGIAYPIGLWLDGDFDWGHHNIVRWDRSHPRPTNWWHEPPSRRDWGHTIVTHPEDHHPAPVSNRGDRGWNRPTVTVIGHSPANTVIPRREPAPAARPEPPARSPSGAFVTSQNTRETQNSSDRGRQSLQTAGHPVAPHFNGGNTGGSRPVKH